MNTMFELYLFLKITEFKEALANDYGFFALSLFLVLLFTLASGLFNSTPGEWHKFIKSKFKHIMIIIVSVFTFQLSCNIVSVLLPSTPQLAVIIIGDKALNNERLQQMPGKLLTILEKKADEYLIELEKKVEIPSNEIKEEIK